MGIILEIIIIILLLVLINSIYSLWTRLENRDGKHLPVNVIYFAEDDTVRKALELFEQPPHRI